MEKARDGTVRQIISSRALVRTLKGLDAFAK